MGKSFYPSPVTFYIVKIIVLLLLLGACHQAPPSGEQISGMLKRTYPTGRTTYVFDCTDKTAKEVVQEMTAYHRLKPPVFFPEVDTINKGLLGSGHISPAPLEQLFPFMDCAHVHLRLKHNRIYVAKSCIDSLEGKTIKQVMEGVSHFYLLDKPVFLVGVDTVTKGLLWKDQLWMGNRSICTLLAELNQNDLLHFAKRHNHLVVGPLENKAIGQ